jgi:hypothetical protein
MLRVMFGLLALLAACEAYGSSEAYGVGNNDAPEV